MSRLLCFGDSFTFGHGLPDMQYKTDSEGNPNVQNVPSEYSWPACLGKLLESQQVINAGALGASNKEIWNTILNTKFLPTDIVIVMWSHHERTCQIKHWPDTLELDEFVWEPRQTGEYWNKKIKAYGPWMDDNATVMNYYLDHWNECDSVLQTILYQNHIELYVKPRVKCLIHSYIPDSQPDLQRDLALEWDVVGLDNMYDTSPVNAQFPLTPCGHMGELLLQLQKSGWTLVLVCPL